MVRKTITFDCYGTLVDWESGITEAFNQEAASDGLEFGRAQLIAAYHDVEPRVQASGYRRYREILAEAALQVASELAWPLAPDRAGFLGESLPDWPVFDDTRLALERLKSRFDLAILSNIDDDLLQATIQRLGVEIDWMVTAQQVRSYKPEHAHFHEAVRRVGGQPERLLHAAQSQFHDIRPATELGLAAVWVNRQREKLAPDLQPLRVVSSVAELADWLGVE